MQSISGRNIPGTLGLGWVSDWDISAATESDGSVLIEDAGAPRIFTPQGDGTYVGEPGDHGILSLIGGAYQLRETDGTVEAFLPSGQLDYVQDSNGNRITAGYNSSGQMISLTDSDGQALTIAYNGQGLISTITDPNGQLAATYSYDSGGHLVTVTTPQGTTQYSYVTGTGTAADNALASITSPDGTQVHYTYDSQGRLTGSFAGTAANPIDPVTLDIHIARRRYVHRCQRGGDHHPVHGPGPAGRGRERPGPDHAALVRHKWQPHCRPAAGRQQLLLHIRRQRESHQPDRSLGLTTTFTYDTNNNLTSYTDAKEHHQYAYDANNNLLSVTYANGAQQQYSYNPLGEATQFLNARGDAIGYTYNAQGLVTQETFADGTSYSYAYDDRGNLTSATDAQGHVTTFVYGGDPNNPKNPDLLTEVEYPDGTFLKFSYYAGGQRKQSVDQTGFTVNYTYDAAGRLSEADRRQRQPHRPVHLRRRRQPHPEGHGQRHAHGLHLRRRRQHAVDHELRARPQPRSTRSTTTPTTPWATCSPTPTRTAQWVYTYDADSQLTQAVFTPNNTDPDGLTAQNLQYVYDAAGNRISETVNGVVTTYVVNNVNEYTSSTTAGVGTTTYQYDLDGNLIATTDPSNNTTIYTFNDLNQLTAVSGPGLTASYFYDPLGNRVSQTVNGATTNFQIDPTGLGNVVAAFSGTGVYNNSGGSGPLHIRTRFGQPGRYVWHGGLLRLRSDGQHGRHHEPAGSYVNRYSLPAVRADHDTVGERSQTLHVRRSVGCPKRWQWHV